MNNIRKIIEERLDNAQIDLKCNINLSVEDVRVLQGKIEAYQDCLNLIPAPRTEQDLERLEQLEKRSLELVNKIDELTEENFQIKRMQTCIWGEQDTVRQKQINDLIKENEKLKKAIEYEIELLIERRFNAYACDNYEVYNVIDAIIEELNEVIFND